MPFNGQRLKIARIFRNMNITELADKVGVKKQAVSQYENGIINPKPEVEFAFVNFLKFPRSFFYEESDNTIIENTFFRALSATSALDRKTQETKTKMIVSIYNFLSEYLEFPSLNLPNVDDISNVDYDDLALKLRNLWGIGETPIINIVNLLENNGIIVSAFDVNSEKIDAFTQIHNLKNYDQFCIVLGNDKKSAVRRNFDVAHELGHILLHRGMGSIEELSKSEVREMENEANKFAAAFLMPKNSFYKDLINPQKLDDYIELKRKWRVSISAMLIRAKQLDRITINEYQSLMKAMSYRKWRIQEPLDDVLQISKPILFSKSIELLFENNILNPQTFMHELSKFGLSLYPKDIEDLLSLEPNTLDIKLSSENINPIITILRRK